MTTSRPGGANPGVDTHPYAAALAESLQGRGSKRTTLKCRTLLSGFGYYRRTESIVADIQRQLEASGLESNFTVDMPESLDDRVAIMLVEAIPQPAAKPPKPAPSAPAGDPITAIERALDATVEVDTESGGGAGFIVHPDGLVVTARHVVDEDGLAIRRVKVTLFSAKPNEKVLDGVVFRSHRHLDFALLWLPARGPFPVLPIGDPQSLRAAQTVYAIGCPEGLPNVVSRGIVCNPRAHFRSVDCIQTDAAIDHGNSGGPLVTESGHAVGINLWGQGDLDAGKFAVPIDYLAEDIELAIRHGRDKCLSAASCPECGYVEYGQPTWYCRNCGTQDIATDQPAKKARKKE